MYGKKNQIKIGNKHRKWGDVELEYINIKNTHFIADISLMLQGINKKNNYY